MESNTSLVALAPSDLGPAQEKLSTFCVEKCAAIQQELADLNEHLLIAKSNGWKLTSLQSAINRAERRIAYYQKMQDAVDAGYLMIPNLPVTLLAVRVAEDATRPRKVKSSSWRADFAADPQLLSSGEGRYVDDRTLFEDASHDEPDGKGGTKRVTEFISTNYDDAIDFPFTGVKPVVLSATAHAMALKVFDTIGLVDNRAGKDPIIVGQLIDPRGNGRRATFFIAWWLNTEDL